MINEQMVQVFTELGEQYKNSPYNPAKETAVEMALETLSHIINNKIDDAQIVAESLAFRLTHVSW